MTPLIHRTADGYRALRILLVALVTASTLLPGVSAAHAQTPTPASRGAKATPTPIPKPAGTPAPRMATPIAGAESKPVTSVGSPESKPVTSVAGPSSKPVTPVAQSSPKVATPIAPSTPARAATPTSDQPQVARSPEPAQVRGSPSPKPAGLFEAPTSPFEGPAGLTVSASPVAASPAASESSRSTAATAEPSRSAAGTVEPPSPRPAASPPAGDDILDGRGLHWPVGEATATLAGTPGGPLPSADGERAGPVRRIVTTLAALQVGAAQLQTWVDESSLWLGVPFRTQIDGSDFSLVNCGPASLAMVLAAFGINVDPPSIRDYVNYLSGDYSTGDGTSLHILARVAREAGLTTFGVSSSWTVEAVRQHVLAGHPVITLVKYRNLPGHGTSLVEFDHYIVITGLAGDDFIYNDAAFASDYGFNLLISPKDLKRGWSYSSVPNHAVAVGLGGSLRPLPQAPPSVTSAMLALGPDAEEAMAVADAAEAAAQPLADEGVEEPPLAMLPGPAAQWLHERMLAEVGAHSSAREAGDAPASLVEPSVSHLELFRDLKEPDALAVRVPAPPPVAPAIEPAAIAEAVEVAAPPAGESAEPAGQPTPGTVFLLMLLVLGLALWRRLNRLPQPS